MENNIMSEMQRDIAIYTGEVQQEIRDAIDKRAREMCNEIKAQSPQRVGTTYRRGGGKYAPGAFRKGWRVRVLRDSDGKYLLAATQNSNQKQLVHLLDRGHRIVTHKTHQIRGRTQGTQVVVRAQQKYRDKLNTDIQHIFNK